MNSSPPSPEPAAAGRPVHDALRGTARSWFESLRDRLCDAFEAIEREHDDPGLPAGRFERTPWQRPASDGGVEGQGGEGEGGGGVISLLRGRVLEKVGR